MKSPLMYQLTEKDSGATVILDGLNFLFNREEMPMELVRLIKSYSVNCFDKSGRFVEDDFSNQFLFFVSSWIGDFAKEKHIPLKANYFSGDDVDLLKIRKCLMVGGCVCLKTYSSGNIYILITNMDDEYMYIFDPYYKKQTQFRATDGVEVIENEPFLYNRRVKIARFVSESKNELALGSVSSREAILLYRNDSMMQRELV